MNTHLRRVLWIVACLGLAAVAQAQPAAEAVRIEGLFARAVPPGQTNSAAFMSLHNTDRVEHALVAAASPVARAVELHTHTKEGGMMRMRRVERIALPPEVDVRLKPGGLHLMLIGLERQLSPGEEVSLTLVYEDGSETTASAPVRMVQPMMH
jgi:copper(I)-binding protein